MSAFTPVINLLGLHHQALQDYFVSFGEKAFRATQVLKWIHQHGVVDLDNMTNLSKSLREYLRENAIIKAPDVAYDHTAQDGTRKWLLKLTCGNCIETVYIPEKNRGTLCVSSQIGCGLNCTFCSTAQQGFNRNLSTAEIIGQVFVAKNMLHEHDQAITNIVLMGMGEPLLNFDNVVAAMDIMMDDNAYGLSKYRVTLSTSGVVPALRKLSEKTDAALAISLHAPNDTLRNELVPINKKYPLKELLAACREHFSNDKRHVTMEYVMLAGINDSLAHAKELGKILQGIRCKVNLIPFNPFPNTRYRCSDANTIEKFKHYLSRTGITTTVRKTRGEDIDGACGQLAGDFQDRTKRRARNMKHILDQQQKA